MIYLTILALLLYLSFYYDMCGKKNNREAWYYVVLFIFILFAGLRWRVGIDTTRYLHSFYHTYPTLADFSFTKYYIGKVPFFVLLNSLVKSMGGRFYMVQILQSAIVNILILNYFKKHSKYIFTCSMFYFLLSYVSFTMEIMRASISIAISLYAFDYFIEKKWVKGYALLLIATMFHAQTLVVFLFPAFLFLRLNKKGLMILVGAYIVGIFLQELLADYVHLFEGNDRLESKVSAYTNRASKYGINTNNINFYVFILAPKIIYPLFALWYTKKYGNGGISKNLQRLEPFIVLGVAFLLIQAHYVIAYRYVQYFTIYFALFYAETCANIIKKQKKAIDFTYINIMLFFSPITIPLILTFTNNPTYIYSSVLDKNISSQKEKQFMLFSRKGIYYSPNFYEY